MEDALNGHFNAVVEMIFLSSYMPPSWMRENTWRQQGIEKKEKSFNLVTTQEKYEVK